MPETNPEITTIRVHKATRSLLNAERDRRRETSVEKIILSGLKDNDSNLDIGQAVRILNAYDDAFSILVEYPDAFKEVSKKFLKTITKADQEVLRKLVEQNGETMVRTP